jgi:hypothetical protein
MTLNKSGPCVANAGRRTDDDRPRPAPANAFAQVSRTVPPMTKQHPLSVPCFPWYY